MSRDAKVNSTEQVPFLEEWKARRERMRLRSSSSSSSSSLVVTRSIDHSVSHHEVDVHTQPLAVTKRQEKEKERGSVKATESTIKTQSHVDLETKVQDSEAMKPKEKKGSTQKKHRTQIEKRKLREKRRPTGVANVPPMEDPDEDQEHNDVKEGHIDHGTGVLNQELRKTQGNYAIRRTDMDSHNTTQDQENNENSEKARQSWLEELQKAVKGKRQDNHKLSTQLTDQEGTLLQLQKDMKTLTQRLRRAEDENKMLKDENQMLMKVMGQLSS
ncbi:uncharacterized protein O3C94_021761 [Discoglossus pictus]